MNIRTFILAVIFLLAACKPSPEEVPAFTPGPTIVVEDMPTPTSSSSTAIVPSTPETIKISPADGMTQILIPEGTFFMGGMDVYRENDELPVREVLIRTFWMDQVEVTNGMYNLCVQSGDCHPPMQLRSDNREEYFGNPDFQDYPVVYVTWSDANAYCQWAGRRLPTEAEWERAARGDDKRNYPWGDEPPNEYNSNSQNFVSDTSRVGSYAEGASPFGILDMGGNVWEWVADRYRPDYYGRSPAENPAGPAEDEVFNSMRVIRGGSFQDDGNFLRLANRNAMEGPNLKAQPDEETYFGKSSNKVGFRCAMDH